MAVGLSGRGFVAVFASSALGWRFEDALGVVLMGWDVGCAALENDLRLRQTFLLFPLFHGSESRTA
jgi:hypothetical protein